MKPTVGPPTRVANRCRPRPRQDPSHPCTSCIGCIRGNARLGRYTFWRIGGSRCSRGVGSLACPLQVCPVGDGVSWWVNGRTWSPEWADQLVICRRRCRLRSSCREPAKQALALGMTASWSRRSASATSDRTSCSKSPDSPAVQGHSRSKAADRSGCADEGPAPLWRRPLRVVTARVASPCCAGGSG